MDTKTLNNFMLKDEKVKHYFKGVMPRDFLPQKLEKKSLYVINDAVSTDPSGGTHWILLSTLSDHYSAYICSLGRKPTHDHVIDSLLSVNNVVLWNDFKNQGDFSTVCSWHCIWTAAMLARGHDLLEIMTQFYTDDTYKNDCSVVEIISTEHGISELIPISDWNFIFTSSLI